nr:IQ domain-containing protein E-like isoform X2 [Pocillopora verrucosa]
MPIPGVTVEDVDAYSDVSNGSTISVGSAASGGSGHMPRPPSGSSKRSKSVQGRRSKVGKSPYSSLQLKSSSKQQPSKPTARNMWITAMRNGTATLSTENSPIKTWGGSRASQNKQNKTGSRSRHLSDYVQIEDLKNTNHIRSASLSASEPQLSIGGPAYKPQEDYYDEIIELKKIINALKAENNILNTKLRRVEGENVLKDRKMEDLLNTRKQPEDVRRTLTDKKGDTSAIVNSLKQKLHAVERTVKDKEAELSQLKKDIKMTNIEELQIQSETYYQEVQRLQLALIEMQQSQLNGSFGMTSPRNSSLSKGTRGSKPSNVSLQRLAEENEHLKADNRALKKDLLTAIENASSSDKKTTLRAEYADMNRGELLAKIHELEEKVQDADGKKTQTRKGPLVEGKEDEEVRRKSTSKVTAEVPGRLELKGTTSQKLAQLQEREVELLEEREKQREIIQRLKEDRAHYREVADDLRVQLKSTQADLDRLREEKGVVGDRRSSTSSASPRRKSSFREVPPQDGNDEEMDSMLKEFQQQRAAKALQRQWRGYQGRKMEIEKQDRQAVERQNQAATTLQKNWRKHRDKTKQMDEESKQEAITQIQAALRGQAARNKYIAQLDKELEFTDRDDAVVALQSAMRAHLARKKHLGYIEEDEITSRDTRTRGSSSHHLGDSEPDSDEGLVTRSSSPKRHPEPATTGLRRSSLTGPRRSLITAPRFANISENSEEDDAVVTSPSRTRSIQKRSGGRVNDSTLEDIRQKPMKKTFEIVDSDDEDDEDDAIVSLPRRSLDTGFSPQRPSLRQSSQPLSSSASSQREVLGSSRDEALQRPGLSLSKRPLSGKRPSLNHSEGGDSGEERTSRYSSIGKSSLALGSEEESDDDAVVSRSSRSQNKGFIQQRPSSQRSSQAISSAASSSREVFDSHKDEVPQRPGLSLSKRPLSGKRPSLDRSGGGDSGEARNFHSSSVRKSSLPMGSEEESDDDDVVVTGRKTKNDKKPARSSLTQKSSASTPPAPQKRERGSIVSSLDSFFSSTASSKDSKSKKSPRKTLAQFNDSDDDDDDDDEDEVVVSSLSGSKSKQKRRVSTDSVANLWATSDSGNDLKTKRKSSLKSSPSNKWNADFEFEKPSHRRPDSQLDELF